MVRIASRIAAVVAVGFLTVLTVPSPSAAVVSTCMVRNLDTGRSFEGRGENLQIAIDQATRGDRLRIRGVCHGSFTLPKPLTLLGARRHGAVRGVLDAGGAGRVLDVVNGGELRSVVIRDGRGRVGGGVVLRHGRLRLTGSTVVRRNHARQGGGVAVAEGRLVLAGRTEVRRNIARDGGGGAFASYAGHVILRDRAQVRANVSRGDGGGVQVDIGIVTMRGSSSVRGNRASGAGGGIANLDGWSWFHGRARVIDNVASVDGGVSVFFGSGGVCSPAVRLTPNAPPDRFEWPVTDC